jgi:hypothetical protein
VSLQDPNQPVIRAFILSRTAAADEQIREVPVEIR